MPHAQTILIAPVILMAACVDPYIPPIESSTAEGFLVVDGYLDGVRGTGTVRLSRSILLGESSAVKLEENAIVTITDEEGRSFSLNEKGSGMYEADGLDLVQDAAYRLHVQTENGAAYTSDAVVLKQSPSFDSLVWRGEEDGVHFYVNSHDDLNETHYYRYRFTETWEYQSSFISRYKNGSDGYPVKRKKNEFVDTCWIATSSSSILITSTTVHAGSMVNMYPVHVVKKGSRRFQSIYSISVQQRPISEEEYSFWNNLQKTSEGLGGLFDPIPGQVVSNVYNDSDFSERVLGYFSGGFPQEKRIFIKYGDLPKDLQEFDKLDFECIISEGSLSSLPDMSRNVWVEIDPTTGVYYITSQLCGDCRALGGDTLKPNFWPQ